VGDGSWPAQRDQLVRLLGVPLFLYPSWWPGGRRATLALGGTTDWDGWIARRLRQVSRLGELLDPLADRLYILATLLAFTARQVVPWQFAAALLARELLLLGSLAVLRRHGYGPPAVHYAARRHLPAGGLPVLLPPPRAGRRRPYAIGQPGLVGSGAVLGGTRSRGAGQLVRAVHHRQAGMTDLRDADGRRVTGSTPGLPRELFHVAGSSTATRGPRREAPPSGWSTGSAAR
jgi:cardiolipin synthase